MNRNIGSVSAIFFFLVTSVHLYPQQSSDVSPNYNSVGESSSYIATAVLEDISANSTNFVFSPLGYAVVLSLLAEGARGQTRDDILKVLQYANDRDIPRGAYKDTLSRMQEKGGTMTPEFKNYFYVYHNFTVLKEYRDTLLEYYLTDVKSTDGPYDEDPPELSSEPFRDSSSTQEPSPTFTSEQPSSIFVTPSHLPANLTSQELSSETPPKMVTSYEDSTKTSSQNEPSYASPPENPSTRDPSFNESSPMISTFEPSYLTTSQHGDNEPSQPSVESSSEYPKPVEPSQPSVESSSEYPKPVEPSQPFVESSSEYPKPVEPSSTTLPHLVNSTHFVDSKNNTHLVIPLQQSSLPENVSINDPSLVSASPTMRPSSSETPETWTILSSQEPSVTPFAVPATEKNSRPVALPLISLQPQPSDNSLKKIKEKKNCERIKRFARKYLGVNLESPHSEMASLSANRIYGRNHNANLSRMLIFNGLYFRGDWLAPFRYKEGQDTFYVSETDKKLVKMMYSVGKFYVGEVPELKSSVVRIPYMGDRYSFLIVLPNAVNGLTKLISDLKSFPLRNIHKYLSESVLQVSVPSFDFSSTSNPSKAFEKYGISRIYSREADFSGISTDSGLFVDDLVQLVSIHVESENASPNFLTAAAVSTRIANEKFSADRPFLFFVEDHKDNIVIAAGKLVDPTLKDE